MILQDKYMITPIALALVNSGYKGNGCGSKPMDMLIAKILQRMFSVDFKMACIIHDAEMERADVLKSDKHRIQADANFEYNCLVCLNGKYTKNRFRLAAWFHVAVTLNTRDIYKPKEL